MIPRSVNVATPEEVVAVLVPTKTPPAEIVAVTVLAAYDVTVLPPKSFTEICGWVVKAAPDAVPTEARVIDSDEAVPGAIVTVAVEVIAEPPTVALTVAVPAVEPGASEAV